MCGLPALDRIYQVVIYVSWDSAYANNVTCMNAAYVCIYAAYVVQRRNHVCDAGIRPQVLYEKRRLAVRGDGRAAGDRRHAAV
eukprot:COSAG03_NODE_584_length_6857_cov_339.944362_10_plen_83_part_00